MCEVASIVDWVGQENQVYSTYNLDSSREIIIKPIGTLVNEKFCMGVGIFPSLYSDVEIVTFNDLDLILSYNEGDAVNGVHSTISIGTSKSLINYSIELDINRPYLGIVVVASLIQSLIFCMKYIASMVMKP